MTPILSRFGVSGEAGAVQWERAIGVTTYEYDKFGRLVTVVGPSKTMTRWSYDFVGRPRRAKTGWWPWQSSRYRYDDSPTGLGRLRSASNRFTRYRWRYDDAGRLAKVLFDEKLLAGLGKAALSYSFDEISRISGVELPDGRTVELVYVGGQLRSIKDKRSGEPIVTYEGVDSTGRPAVQTLADGTRTLRARDKMGRLKSLLVETTTQSTNFTFEYEVDGNLRRILKDGTLILEAGYDSAGRIAKLWSQNRLRQFHYDDLSNLVEVSPSGPALRYGEGEDHPHAISRLNQAEIPYDSAMRALRFGGASFDYRRNAIRKIEYEGDCPAADRVRYDALGRPYYLKSGCRKEKRALGLWSARQGVCNVGIPSPSGVVAFSPCGESSYTFFHGGPGPLVLGTTSSTPKDHLLKELTPDPFLPLPKPIEAFVTPATFALSGAGLELHGERLRISELGRFLQPDPVYPPESSIRELNRYAYAQGNPLRYADPLGRQTFDFTLSFGAPSGSMSSLGSLDFFSSSSFMTPQLNLGFGNLSGIGFQAGKETENITVMLRSFAPFKSFGGGFEGDDRSFSSQPNSGASARITGMVTLNPLTGEVVGEPSVFSNTTRCAGPPCSWIWGGESRTASPTITAESVDGAVLIKMAGSNPLVPRAPDINLSLTVRFGPLGVTGGLVGDAFPNAEVILLGPGGATFLHSFSTPGGPTLGPLRLFPGTGETPMGNFWVPPE